MAHFYLTADTARGYISKTGTKKGMTVHAGGWNIGIKLILRHNEETNLDSIEVYQTSGSNDNGKTLLIADVVEEKQS